MSREPLLRAAALITALQPALLARAEVHFVVVGGLGGEPAYEQRFAAEARDLEAAGRTLSGDPSHVRALSGKAATREAVQAAFGEAARHASSEDVLVSIFVGHGNVDGTVYKLNLPGPDPTCDELRRWLDHVPARRQLVVLATSASGGCVAPLQRTGRVVLSATRSGTERNVPVFSRYFVEALRDPAADRDHDENVTALEAFRYAEQKVQRFYADAKRLATEHPTLSSDGAREFVVARRGAAARLASHVKPAPPALAARRAALENEVHALRERKAGMESEAYWSELEGTLVELARVQNSIDAATGQR